MTREIKRVYEFGKFCFDAQKLALTHDGETVQLPPKSLETLKVLLEQKGETVSREFFFERIWAESFVEDANLTVAVSTLRKTLAAFDKNSTFIQTVSGRGYRFVGDAAEKIEKIEIAEQPPQSQQQPQPIVIERHALEQLTVERQMAQRPVSRILIAVALLVLITATAFAVWLGRRDQSSAVSESDARSANEAFQKGDALLRGKRESCLSIPYFREAAARNENFARAFSGLAAALAMCGDKGTEAEESIAKSLALDANSAEANATDGFIKMFRRWDWSGAETALRRSVALDPNSAQAHHWLATCLSIRGNITEAEGEMQRAIEIEPNSANLYADLGQMYYFHRQYFNAINECRKALEIDPNFVLTPKYLRDIYLMKEDEKSAVEWHIKFMTLSGTLPDDIAAEREVFEREGYKGWTRRTVETHLAEYNLKKATDADYSMDFSLVEHYAALGDKENALLWLRAAVDCTDCVRSLWLPYVAVDPRYNFLRDDARFQAVLQKMNLAN